MSKTTIYVVRLEKGRFYVGKTENIAKRYQEHLNGTGAAWTRKYTPIYIEKTIQNASPFEEDKVVKEYMSTYGIDMVRGGSYVTEYLDETQEMLLQQEIWAATDCCTNCGRKGHYVSTCFAKTDVNGYEIEYENEDDEEEEDDEDDGEENSDDEEEDEDDDSQ
jgi:predicted GIY-YIG superfamily endonuclease